MYVLLETGGKQYKVSQDDELNIERLEAEVGSKVILDKVLAMKDENKLEVGKPYLENVKVEATVLENGKGPKLVVFKMRSKKASKVKNGHRQPFTKIKIDKITKK